MTTTTRYTITNSTGTQGSIWGRTYDTQGDAAEAIRIARGWGDVVLSDEYTTDDGEAVSAYPDADAMAADADGSRGDRITARRGSL